MCEVCGKAFTFPPGLSLHKSIHTLDKPYQCDVCGKDFYVSSVHQDIRSHTGKTPYKCEECGKALNCPSALSKHKRTPSGENPSSVKYVVNSTIAHQDCTQEYSYRGVTLEV